MGTKLRNCELEWNVELMGHLLREWDTWLDASIEFESPAMCSGTYPLVIKRYFKQGGIKVANWARARPKIKFLKNVPKIFYRWPLNYVNMAKS